MSCKDPPVIGYLSFRDVTVTTVAEPVPGGCLVSRITVAGESPMRVLSDTMAFVPNVTAKRTNETITLDDGSSVPLYKLVAREELS